jgi:hypothetical protein
MNPGEGIKMKNLPVDKGGFLNFIDEFLRIQIYRNLS